MKIYATCTYGENETIITRMSTNKKDCQNLIAECKQNAKKYGFNWNPENYWIEEIEIRNGIFWECN